MSSPATVPFVIRNSGALTQYACPAPCLATVVFTAMGAGQGYTHRCDAGHKWLREDGKWEQVK